MVKQKVHSTETKLNALGSTDKNESLKKQTTLLVWWYGPDNCQRLKNSAPEATYLCLTPRVPLKQLKVKIFVVRYGCHL